MILMWFLKHLEEVYIYLLIALQIYKVKEILYRKKKNRFAWQTSRLNIYIKQ